MTLLTSADRLVLFERYRPLSYQLARRMMRKLPFGFEQVEIETIALGGLWSACRRTNTNGVEFGAYAGRRIIGSLQDFLRLNDHANRYGRAQERRTGVPLGVRVTGVDPDDLDKFAAPDTVPVIDTAALAAAIATLPARTQEIIIRYDLGGERLRDIGKALGISEPRVSQLRTEAFAELRESGLLDGSVLET